MARHSSFTQELADKICNYIAGGMSLRKLCELDGMPTKETVRVWLRDNETFSAQYARARDEQADFYADEIIEIADNETDPQKARVRVDSRKWIASKLKPKRYGDKLEVDNKHSGEVSFINDVPRPRVWLVEFWAAALSLEPS